METIEAEADWPVGQLEQLPQGPITSRAGYMKARLHEGQTT